ncbi:hypothetical protein E6O75_ATG06231 [Venturia nashicola]|uniref:Uncharacterized protein n=1 Tax=Venturia nashicola TaxID=86259 RepID=A0A4Z1P4V4_9PEZI|nr:hypothetical protein E6O75_ATG06231 [Venturia nashicola]
MDNIGNSLDIPNNLPRLPLPRSRHLQIPPLLLRLVNRRACKANRHSPPYIRFHSSRHDRITASVVAFLENLPTISAAVSPFLPSQCSPFAGPGNQTPLVGSSSATGSNSLTSSVAAVTHTSVQFLITQGQAVITRSLGTVAPQMTLQTTSQGGSFMDNGGSSISTPMTRLPSSRWVEALSRLVLEVKSRAEEDYSVQRKTTAYRGRLQRAEEDYSVQRKTTAYRGRLQRTEEDYSV